MATANAGRKAAPPNLRIVKGKGKNSAGEDLDSGGRVIPPGKNWRRLAPEKPEHITGYAGEMWDQVISELERVELLKPIDGPALEMLCGTYERWRLAVQMRQEAGMDSGLLAENSQGNVTAPWIGIEERASKEFRAWCAEFGLTPAAENKVGGGNGGEGNGEPDLF